MNILAKIISESFFYWKKALAQGIRPEQGALYIPIQFGLSAKLNVNQQTCKNGYHIINSN